MTKEELRKEFIRSIEDAEGVEIQVRTMSWRSLYEAVSTWVVGARLAPRSSPAARQAAIDKLLRSRTYFPVCASCDERKPRGYMHDATVCMDCAVEEYGIVY